MLVSRAVLAVLAAVCTAASAAAQADPPLLPSRSITAPLLAPLSDSPAQQLLALQKWTTDYENWRIWYARWRNTREPGWMASRGRRPRPDPPPWLPAACASLVEDSGPLVDGCREWELWRRDDFGADTMAQQVAQARADHESPRTSVWWEHIHLDAFWPMTQVGSNAFGVAGVHTTLPLTKRMQVFLTPGAILMRLPAISGGGTWSAATDWGFSYRLFDFRMPAVGRPSTLHFNMARVWVLGGGGVPMPGELYLAGFSVTFKSR